MDAPTSFYIDSHIHLLDQTKFNYPWAENLTNIINEGPQEVAERWKGTPVRGAIVIQGVDNSLDETDWLLQLAKNSSEVWGVVGGLNLTDPQLGAILDRLSCPELVGLRHCWALTEADDWLGREDVNKGLATLSERGLTFDLLLWPKHISLAVEVASKHPRLRFVVDHIGLPIYDDTIDRWQQGMQQLAKLPNVYCKLSHLSMFNVVTNTDWKEAAEKSVTNTDWKGAAEKMRQYTTFVLNEFGAERCMYGSDWPVTNALSGASYHDSVNITETLTDHLSDEQKDQVFRKTCMEFYGLKSIQ